eukprot:GHVO01035442.1.p2 GENE.GHVO01035442.1~~GHVO01035442.1.p2  ORF type:complete len:103 (-),score=11.72 GHVO01035442.1:129-437(-)
MLNSYKIKLKRLFDLQHNTRPDDNNEMKTSKAIETRVYTTESEYKMTTKSNGAECHEDKEVFWHGRAIKEADVCLDTFQDKHRNPSSPCVNKTTCMSEEPRE